MADINQFDQPLGKLLTHWQEPARPQKILLQGNFCRLEPLTLRHAADLFASWHSIDDERDWSYFPVSRPRTLKQCETYISSLAASEDPLFYAVINEQTSKAVGSVALQNIDTRNGALEIGWANWSPYMKRTASATEALYLLLVYVFADLHYRRCEWKVDTLNRSAISAAERLGFRYEGTFRQGQVVNGRNSDVRWYSIIDGEWTDLGRALNAWLRKDNFDERGRQIQRLSDFMSKPS